jgi:hypothetical protein
MAVSHDDIGARLPPVSERSVAGLFGDLAHQGSRLFHQEITLARAEFEAKLGQLGSSALTIIVGGSIIYAGFLALLVAAGLGLALVMRPWLAAVAVGGVTVVIGTIIAFMGKHAVGSGALVPKRTLRSLREDAAWARGQMR